MTRLGGKQADFLALALLLLVCLSVRLAFYTSAPPFLNPDSAGYYVPGRNLVMGDGFNLGLRRTPTYPLFIAGVVALAGEDLQALVTVQHALFGPVLVILTFVLGRLLAGRLVAFLAAGLSAISGPLLLYEHYVMTEVPFAILLMAVLVTLVLAQRRGGFGWPALCGLLFGALILCRPVGQILAPIVVGVLLLGPGGWRQRGLAVAVTALCATIVVLPWMAYNQRTQGVFTIAGSGRFLLARTLKMDPGGFVFETPPGTVEDETRAAARRIVQEEAARSRPGSVAQRLRDELDLSDAEAYPLMGSFAAEAIKNRPSYFVSSSVSAFFDILLGRPINVRREGVPVSDADFERTARAALRKPVYPRDVPRAQGLLSIYDPSLYGWLVPLLFGLGLVMAAFCRTQRWLLLPGLVALALIGASATLVGPELRYRFPQEPLIVLVAVGGVVTVARLVAARLARRRPHPEIGEAVPTPDAAAG
jgi:4-amino-4-deoxy-L-arabinose transferase-like glycosyltransferase